MSPNLGIFKRHLLVSRFSFRDFLTIFNIYNATNYRRKFGSQTSDNMDRWKSRDGKSQRREEKRRSEKRKSQKKEDAGVRKGRKVAIHCGFPMICGSAGSKGRLRRVRSHLAREMENCTRLWREAHLEVKMHKTHHVRSTFGILMSKKCTLLWREAHFEVKC